MANTSLYAVGYLILNMWSHLFGFSAMSPFCPLPSTVLPSGVGYSAWWWGCRRRANFRHRTWVYNQCQQHRIFININPNCPFNPILWWRGHTTECHSFQVTGVTEGTPWREQISTLPRPRIPDSLNSNTVAPVERPSQWSQNRPSHGFITLTLHYTVTLLYLFNVPVLSFTWVCDEKRRWQ